VLILDACREKIGSKGRGSTLGAQTVEFAKERGVTTIFSCGYGQLSYELEALQQGAFTHALVEGLGQFTLPFQLEPFLQQRVNELHREAGKSVNQTPKIQTDSIAKAFQSILPDCMTPDDVKKLKEMAIDAECDGEIEKAIRLWEQVNLLAEGNDRQRAVKKIKHLSSNQSAARYVVKTQSSLGTPIEFPVFEVQEKSAPTAPELQPQHPIDTILIESKEDVEYRKLRDLLEEGKWKEADQETWNVMCQVLDKQQLQVKDLKTYPLDAIVKIDELWAEASQDRFGFGAQAKLWLEVGQDKSAFEIKVGWCPGPNKRQKDYEKLTFDLDRTEVGHLPAFFKSWGGGGWSWTQYLLDRVAQSIDLVPLGSERDIDYRNLRDLLKAEKWRESDEETLKVMIKAANRDNQGYLDTDSLKLFPCEDLQTIDRLWTTASKGHFGFSVQIKIWEECGSPVTSNIKWAKFWSRIGWRNEGRWACYEDLKFTIPVSPVGELPAMGWGGGKGFGNGALVFKGKGLVFIEQRRAQCQTSQSCSSIQPVTTPLPPNVIDTVPGIDYRKLKDLLKDGKWEEADQETLQVMLQALNCPLEDWPNADSLKKFPSQDLRTIDQLWVTASNGHFGFSVQAKIWQDCGSPIHTGDNWDHFCIRVGWQNSIASAYMTYFELKKNPLTSALGELPRMGGRIGGVGSVFVGRLLCIVSSLSQRFVDCGPQQFNESESIETTSPPEIVDSATLAPAPQNAIDDVPLESEKGVDYRKLRDLLREGKWEEADRETLEVMLKATNRPKWAHNTDAFKNLPYQDLRTIDQLWVTASGGQFGFSIQKRIWEKCGSPTSKTSGSSWENFILQLGWEKALLRKAALYEKFSTGELPRFWCFYGTLAPWFSGGLYKFLGSHKNL
jgi:hypothetical protein